MAYVSGALPEDRDAKPVCLGVLVEFFNIVCRWKPVKDEFVCQPTHDVKYFTNGTVFLSSVLIADFDVIVPEHPVKPFGPATTMGYKHADPSLLIIFSRA